MNGKSTKLLLRIYKSGDRCQIQNYRLISLLCITSKVLERLVYNNRIDHIYLHKVFVSHYQTDAIYLNISKAFDTVSHSHLLFLLIFLVAFGFGLKPT